MSKQFWYVAIVIALMHLTAQVSAAYFEVDRPLAIAAFTTGVLGFLWILSWAQWREGGPISKEAALRAAIAGGIVLQYLSIVATVSFFSRGEPNAAIDPVANSFITSFTTVVAVVIAFYFGASAYVEGKREAKGGDV